MANGEALQADIQLEDVIYVDSIIGQHIDCDLKFGDIEVDVTVGDIEVALQLFIPVDLQVSPEIFIDYEIDLTTRELMYMHELVGDAREIRMQKVARYRFTMKASIQEIAEMLHVTPNLVYRDLKEFKQGVLQAIKKDLRGNKKILGHMVELMTQLDNQTRTLWDRYNSLEADAAVYRKILRIADEQASSTGDVKNIVSVERAMNRIFQVHDRQTQYLNLLRELTKEMRATWKEFGLTGDDAMKIILSGGVDIDVKIKQTKEVIISLIEIIKLEVSDLETRKKIFSRLANDIRIKTLSRHEQGEEIEDGSLV